MRGLTRAICATAATAAVLLVPAAGQAGGPVAPLWSPSTGGAFDYGTLDVGTTASQTFTLTSPKGKFSGLKITLSGSAAFTKTADSCSGTNLEAKKAPCSVTVQYAATAVGQSDTATLTASSKKPFASASVTLTGKSVAATVACPGSRFLGGTALPDIVNGKITCLVTVPGASITTNGTLDATTPLGADTFAYDQAGHLLRIGDPSGVPTDFGSPPGSLLSAGATTFVYDSAGEVVSATGSAGMTSFGYDSAGNLTSIVAPSGATTNLTYDGSNRLVAAPGIDFTYDSQGDLTSAGGYSFTYDVNGRLAGLTDPHGIATTYSYDSAGDLVSAGATSFTYSSGRLTTITDPVAGTTNFTYDSQGRLVQATTSPPGGGSSSSRTFSYDDVNEIETVTDPQGHISKFFFDATGNVVKLVDAQGTTNFTYR